MSKHYASIAFTDDVRAVQSDHGSDAFYGRKIVAGKATPPGRDSLTEDEKDYLSERDGFYLASVSETGWPYVQFRGGKPGYIHVVDDHTIGWADFRGGNLQYISTGNMTGDDRVAIIVLDYAHQRRLKNLRACAHRDGRRRPGIAEILDRPDRRLGGRAGCPRRRPGLRLELPAAHHPPRFSTAELEPAVEPLRAKLAELQAEKRPSACPTRRP